MDDSVRWNIKASKDADITLRSFLATQGTKKGDLSKFIEDAVLAHVFHKTVEDIKTRNAGTDPDELQDLIDEALETVRSTSPRHA